MSEFVSMADLTKEVFRLHVEQRYTEALEMLAQQQGNFPEHQDRIYYWRMCFAALSGAEEQSLSLFAESLDQGCWYAERMLRRDTDLEILQGNPVFEQLMARNADVVAEAQTQVKPYRIELLPKSDPPHPLLVALHGNTSNAAEHVDYWRLATQYGWAVMLPQSTQVAGMDTYIWDDLDWANQEISTHIDEMHKVHPLDIEHLVLAGFSKGAQLATGLALSRSIPARGIIAVAGYFSQKHLHDWQRYVASTLAHKASVSLIVGDKDTNCLPGVQTLHDLLTENGYRSQLQVFTGLDHAYPEGWDNVLKATLDFMSG